MEAVGGHEERHEVKFAAYATECSRLRHWLQMYLAGFCSPYPKRQVNNSILIPATIGRMPRILPVPANVRKYVFAGMVLCPGRIPGLSRLNKSAIISAGNYASRLRKLPGMMAIAGHRCAHHCATSFQLAGSYGSITTLCRSC